LGYFLRSLDYKSPGQRSKTPRCRSRA
jgi:hypothetical protein